MKPTHDLKGGQLELKFTQDKETPKKVRFSLEPDNGAPVSGSLYVEKAEAEKLAKDGVLTVTIKAAS